MNDSSISLSKLVTLALWAWTLGTLGFVWVALWLHHNGLMHAFGFTACASSAVAATAQIRRYSLALCAVMKGRDALAGGRGSVHSL